MLDRDAFLSAYGGIYEHSPWVAERAWPRSGGKEGAALHAVMKAVVDEASRTEKLALLCAHPDLSASKTGREALTAYSRTEQTVAGLAACTPEEAKELETMNAAYRAKFGFPFIIAVKGLQRHEILAAFRKRLAETDGEAEFARALNEVHKIALLRLQDRARA